MPRTRTFILLAVVFFLFAAFSLWYLQGQDAPDTPEQASVQIGKNTFNVILAETQAELVQGLSGRPSLAKDTGMLFLFGTSAIRRFWMKDMLFSLDIIWIDESGTIVEITHDLSPDTYPDNFGPDIPTRYVLEVNAGVSREKGINIGDTVRFDL